MQICELQEAEDFGVVFGEDLAVSLSEEKATIIEGAASGEQMAEVEGTASDEEVAEDATDSLGVGEQAGRQGDTTEESSAAGVDDSCAVASPSPLPPLLRLERLCRLGAGV